jgi:nucleoside-diphosphate-sugar epimerase
MKNEFARSRVLITGGPGFIGSNLARRLVATARRSRSTKRVDAGRRLTDTGTILIDEFDGAGFGGEANARISVIPGREA